MVLKYSKSKTNTKPLVGYCKSCLERTYIREVKDGAEKRGTCIRCLEGINYKSTLPTMQARLFLKKEMLLDKLTINNKITRYILRGYKYLFVGTWNRKRFDIRILKGK